MGKKVNSVNRKSVTLQEFIKLKGLPPFSNLRHHGKQIGLAFLFGRGGRSFSSDLDLSWSEEESNNFIADNSLHEELEIARKKYAGSYSEKQIKLIVCANHIRNVFFQTYPGLEKRIENNREFSQENGYIRSIYGAFRRLPQLHNLSPDDYEKYSNEIYNLLNIATNSDIQNFESSVINRAIIEIHNFLKGNNLKSRLVDQTHDALTLYVHRDEISKVYTKIKEITEKYYPEYWKIPLEVEGKHCDLKDGGWYKHGKNWEEFLNYGNR